MAKFIAIVFSLLTLTSSALAQNPETGQEVTLRILSGGKTVATLALTAHDGKMDVKSEKSMQRQNANGSTYTFTGKVTIQFFRDGKRTMKIDAEEVVIETPTTKESFQTTPQQ